MLLLNALTLPHLAAAPQTPPAGTTLLYAKTAGLHACTPSEQDVPLWPTWRRLAANQSGGTVGATVAGLSMSVTAGTYAVTYFGTYTAANTSAGIGVALQGPAASAFTAHAEIARNNTDGVNCYPLTGLGTYTVTSGGSMAATPLPLLVRALITFTAAGTLSLLVKSSVNTVSLRLGSHVMLRWVGP
jgi:hypothetical protein